MSNTADDANPERAGEPIDWQRLRQEKFTSYDGPLSWPKDVRPISYEGLTLFGLDKRGHVYFDGERLVVDRELRLSSFQAFLLSVTAAGAFASGLVAVIRLLLER